MEKIIIASLLFTALAINLWVLVDLWKLMKEHKEHFGPNRKPPSVGRRSTTDQQAERQP